MSAISHGDDRGGPENIHRQFGKTECVNNSQRCDFGFGEEVKPRVFIKSPEGVHVDCFHFLISGTHSLLTPSIVKNT